MGRFAPKWTKGDEHGSSDKQERRLAEKVGGSVTPASGATKFAKGDVTTEDWLFEAKMTGHESLSIKGSWLVKISKEAALTSKQPALAIEIGGVQDPMCERDWVCIPLSSFRMLTGKNPKDRA